MVRELSPVDLKAWMDSEEPLHLYDVRTDEERAICQLPGAIQLTEELAEEIGAMDKGTKLVFHCHHGGRSFQAANHFLQQGFGEVYNVAGGIDAWSLSVDAAVPRY